MNDALLEILDRVIALWRLRWWVITVAWVVCCVGWFVVLAMPNVYESSAKVFVDTRSALQPILQGIGVEHDVNAEVNRVQQALLSRPQLEEVARLTKLDDGVRSPEDMDGVVLELQRSLSIEVEPRREGGDSGDNLYTITYRNGDRNKSLAVVERLLASFIGDTLGGNQAGSESAQKFLREQIQDYQNRLAETEARLAEFKKENEGLIPGGRGDYFSRLSAEVDANQKSQTDLSIAISRRAELRRQLSDASAFVPGVSNGPLGAGPVDLPSRIQENEARLQELLLRYTDKHPEVIALRDTIASLKQQQAQELAAIEQGGTGSGAIRNLSVNPVHQNTLLQLNQTDVEIAALRGAIAQHELEISRLRSFVNKAPDVEQRFATLNRDYDVTKAQYAALVERMERARISEDADRTGVVRFRVIDPPAAAINPVAPNRPILILAVLAAGLAAGLMVALVAQQVQPVFSGAHAVMRATGLPVLGTIGAVVTDQIRAAQSRDMKLLVGTCAALVLAAGFLLVSQNRAAEAIHTLLSMGAASS
jgi:polysaccharide chain length determinant protein (PEP-CTERM system associated)